LPKTDETRLIYPVFTKTEKNNPFLTSFSIQPETGSKNLPDDQNSATAESEFWADFLTEPSRPNSKGKNRLISLTLPETEQKN
jgi:hypothetical protein